MVLAQTGTELEHLEGDIRSLAERVLPSVVLVQNGSGDGGSGVRWSDDLIISNHHVVHDDTCRIGFLDGLERTGVIIARDPTNDLAAIRLDAAVPLEETALPRNPERQIRVGEMVIAVGQPMGARWAATTGIISRVPAATDHRRLLRASLTLMPGNSGGAMVNIHGELVGINTMVTGPAEALAIPVDIVDAFARMVTAAG